MKTSFQLKALSFFVCAFLATAVAFAQEKPQPSPRDSIGGTINGANILINYGSPSVRGRAIWGGLVPYDKTWRTGANQATTITISKDVKVEGEKLPAGKYSLFTVPGKKKWKVIFNSQVGQWGIKQDGTANDDPTKDVLTVTVKAQKSKKFSERMVFVINEKDFSLMWENVTVPVKVK